MQVEGYQYVLTSRYNTDSLKRRFFSRPGPGKAGKFACRNHFGGLGTYDFQVQHSVARFLQEIDETGRQQAERLFKTTRGVRVGHFDAPPPPPQRRQQSIGSRRLARADRPAPTTTKTNRTRPMKKLPPRSDNGSVPAPSVDSIFYVSNEWQGREPVWCARFFSSRTEIFFYSYNSFDGERKPLPLLRSTVTFMI